MNKQLPPHPDEIFLHAYLDEALTEEEQALVEAHLATCADCTAEMARLQMLFDTIEAWLDEPLSRDLSSAIIQHLQHEKNMPRLERLLAAQLIVAIALLLIIHPWDTLPATTSLLRDMNPHLIEGARLIGARMMEVLHARLMWVEQLPTFSLSPSRWGIVLGFALIGWVAANSLLLRRTTNE